MPFVNIGSEQIYYAERGRGFPVILIHGAGGNHLIWGAQLRALGDKSRTIALDLPGHGMSPGAGRDSIEAYSDLVLAFLDALAIERAVLVGHSMGGAIVQTMALSHLGRASALGLIGTGARLRVLPAILNGVLPDFENTVRMVIENSFAAGADRAMMSKSETQLRACDPLVLHGDYLACNAFDVLDRVSQIRAPTLLICGREDRMTPPKYSEFLASRIANARLEWIEGAGHQVMIEQPGAVSRALVSII
jgi:pimeloyl-ACP methyl ester carboxylesterase